MNYQTKKFMKAINASMGIGRIKVVSEEGSCLYLSVRPKNMVAACQACLSAGAVFDPLSYPAHRASFPANLSCTTFSGLQ